MPVTYAELKRKANNTDLRALKRILDLRSEVVGYTSWNHAARELGPYKTNIGTMYCDHISPNGEFLCVSREYASDALIEAIIRDDSHLGVILELTPPTEHSWFKLDQTEPSWLKDYSFLQQAIVEYNSAEDLEKNGELRDLPAKLDLSMQCHTVYYHYTKWMPLCVKKAGGWDEYSGNRYQDILFLDINVERGIFEDDYPEIADAYEGFQRSFLISLDGDYEGLHPALANKGKYLMSQLCHNFLSSFDRAVELGIDFGEIVERDSLSRILEHLKK